MHASKQSEEAEVKRYLRMVNNRHTNVQSVGAEDSLLVHKLKRFEGKHAGIFSVIFCFGTKMFSDNIFIQHERGSQIESQLSQS